jgi:hypothetical protein
MRRIDEASEFARSQIDDAMASRIWPSARRSAVSAAMQIALGAVRLSVPHRSKEADAEHENRVGDAVYAWAVQGPREVIAMMAQRAVA